MFEKKYQKIKLKNNRLLVPKIPLLYDIFRNTEQHIIRHHSFCNRNETPYVIFCHHLFFLQHKPHIFYGDRGGEGLVGVGTRREVAKKAE